MITKSFKKILGVFTFILFAGNITHAAGVCGLNTTRPDWCNRMGHLRATINSLDSQRELMQVNYEHLLYLGISLEKNAEQLQQVAPASANDHIQALTTIKTMGTDLIRLAKSSDPEALTVANSVRSQCLNCHATSNPTSDVAWNDVFGYDWSKVSKFCSLDGRNPYLCKSMNGMMTAYIHFMTAYKADINNYEVTASVGKEVVRILRDLKQKNFNHLGEANRQVAESQAQEIVNLAQARKPEVFKKAFDLTSTCMNCHNSQPASAGASKDLYKVWN